MYIRVNGWPYQALLQKVRSVMTIVLRLFISIGRLLRLNAFKHFVTPQFFSPLRPLIFLRAQSSEFIGQFLHDPGSGACVDQWENTIVTRYPIRGQRLHTQLSTTTRLPYCVVWLPGFRGNDFNVIFTRNFSFQSANIIILPRQLRKQKCPSH